MALYSTGCHLSFTASIVFVGYAIICDPPLTAMTIFTVLQYYVSCKSHRECYLTFWLILIQVKVSLDRMDKLLQDDELRQDVGVRKALAGSQYTTEIHQVIFSWDPESSLPKPTLKGINLQIKRGRKGNNLWLSGIREICSDLYNSWRNPENFRRCSSIG